MSSSTAGGSIHSSRSSFEPSLTLPKCLLAYATRQPHRSRGASIGSMVKILVVDDEYLVRYTLARILRRQGYEVVTAADGERGMAAFRSDAPDLVIADIVMFERERRVTIQQMRGERPHAHIISISGGG